MLDHDALSSVVRALHIREHMKHFWETARTKSPRVEWWSSRVHLVNFPAERVVWQVEQSLLEVIIAGQALKKSPKLRVEVVNR